MPATSRPGTNPPAQEHRQDSPPAGAHCAKDADFALLLDHAHHQHAGDAERHDDHHEAADQRVGHALVSEGVEQAGVRLHPAVHRQSGLGAQRIGHPIGVEEASDGQVDIGDAAGQVEQSLRELQGDETQRRFRSRLPMSKMPSMSKVSLRPSPS